MRHRLLPLAFLSLLACSSDGDKLPCDGMCGTLVTKVTLIDTTGAPVTCEAAGASDVVLTVLADNKELASRKVTCGAVTELGPINLGTYQVRATVRDAAGTGIGEHARTSSLVKDGDRNDVEIPVVPGPPSKLGQACSGSCPDGYACVQVDLGGTKTAFCTPECGTAPVMSQGPMNGDLVCRAGWTGPGQPRCQLYGDGTGTVAWSCLIACGGDGSCPTGMTCLMQSATNAVCINP